MCYGWFAKHKTNVKRLISPTQKKWRLSVSPSCCFKEAVTSLVNTWGQTFFMYRLLWLQNPMLKRHYTYYCTFHPNVFWLIPCASWKIKNPYICYSFKVFPRSTLTPWILIICWLYDWRLLFFNNWWVNWKKNLHNLHTIRHPEKSGDWKRWFVLSQRFSFWVLLTTKQCVQGVCQWLASLPSFLATAAPFFSSTRPNPMSSSSKSPRTWAAS